MYTHYFLQQLETHVYSHNKCFRTEVERYLFTNCSFWMLFSRVNYIVTWQVLTELWREDRSWTYANKPGDTQIPFLDGTFLSMYCPVTPSFCTPFCSSETRRSRTDGIRSGLAVGLEVGTKASVSHFRWAFCLPDISVSTCSTGGGPGNLTYLW